MKKWVTGFGIAICTLVFTMGCSDEQNFDQFDDLSVTPTLATSIFYLESDESTINLASSGSFYSEVFTFEAFSEEFVAERVLEGVITYQVENTTSKEIDITVEFLDAGGNVLDTEAFTVEAHPAPLLERQIAYGNAGRSLDILRNTTNIRVGAVNQSDNSSTSSQPQPKIVLRSSAEFRFRLK